MKQVFEVLAVTVDEKGELVDFLSPVGTYLIANNSEDAKIKYAAKNSKYFTDNTKEVVLLARPFVKNSGLQIV
jgi:hypothetical protein